MPDPDPELTDLPLFPLGTVLFPGMPLPLHLFEQRYRRLLREHRQADPIFGVVLTRQGVEVGDEPETHAVGTAATLLGIGHYPDGRADIVVRGTRRFRIAGGEWSRGYLMGRVAWLDDPLGEPEAAEAAAVELSRRYAAFLSAFQESTGVDLPDEDLDPDPAPLAYAIAARLPLNTWEQQRLLEAETVGDRLVALNDIIRREARLLRETGAGGAIPERPGGRFTAN